MRYAGEKGKLMDDSYPRDMIGYGRTPPFADWPGGARVALQFVINYEEGGENNILHGDAASEAFLSEIVGAAPWPGQRHMNMESIYEYGSRAGFWRLHRMFTERSTPVTVYAVATAMARNPEAVAAMNEAGWEIATHGYKWIDYRDTPADIEARDIAEAIRIHTEVAGARPLGFYQGRSSVNTIRLGCEEGGFVYCADAYADDLPYWIEGPKGPQLIVPYTLDTNDMRFATPQGFNSGDQFYAYLKDSFDTLYQEGATAPKMLSIGLHCRLVGRPGRAAALARFLDYARSHDKVWIATRLDIARHWIRRHPPQGGWKPSRLSRTLFVERFGGVYEHSRWVAEAAYDAGLSANEDAAAGLAKAMARAMAGGSEADKRRLIDAHPDLAGKLALAKGLTAESTEEQKSAGLDRLSQDELTRFTALNDAYRARFGFPFIMAVRGKTKADILAAFERRLAHDAPTEVSTALAEIDRIAALRIAEIVS
jgi:OHCU decarboxylase